MSKEPEQLDLLDWIAAQEPGPAPGPPQPIKAPALTGPGGETDSVLLTRVDPGCNMRRFYGLTLVRSLWGEQGVARQWGRIGGEGQRQTDWHANLEEALADLARLAERKRRRGYR